MENELNDFKDILVSIVIVSFNCSDVIAESLQSCINIGKTEIIVIDNASSDNSISVINSIVCQNIKLIINRENLGFTRACNQGIRIAQGEFIMLLNPDASLQKDCIKILTNYMNLNPEIGIVSPCLFYPDGTFQNYTRTFPTVSGLWVESFVPMKFWNSFKSYRKYTCQDLDFNKKQFVEQPAGAALMFRNQWSMDENYFIYGSDVDLCKTVIEAGFKIVQIPDAKVYHYQSKGGTNNIALKTYLDLDNYFGMYYFFKKHKHNIKAFLYKSIFLFSLFFRAILSVFEGRNSFILRWKKFYLFSRNKNFTAINDL